MGYRGIFDDESGGEHAGGEFSAVQTVAYEDLGNVFAFDWLTRCQQVSLGLLRKDVYTEKSSIAFGDCKERATTYQFELNRTAETSRCSSLR